MDCIFCKIVAEEMPSYKIYEDEHFLAFLAVPSLNPGHTLVIPKKHFQWVWDLPIDRKISPNIGQYYELVGKIANAIRQAYNIEWVVSLVLGEEVPHAHVWLVPRFKGDGHGGAIDLRNIKELNQEEMKQAAEKIKENIK